MSYQEFLAAKAQRVNEIGPDVPRSGVHPMLHDWQAEIVQWAARTGRAAIWADIRETNTLNVRVAREDADERHICPLQLDFIERCVRLWSNPAETVFTPFCGIGSEVYVARSLERRGLGIELKPSYWRTAVDNLERLDLEMGHATLFDPVA